MIKIIILLILFFSATRLFFLDSDPSILLNSGQVGDEGYWVYNARNLKLFKTLALDDFYHDIAAAPVFTFFSYLFFNSLGVGFFQARLVSAIAGLITILLCYKIAAFFLDTKYSLVAAFFCSINTLLLLHNRLAVPESLAFAFLFSALFFWLRNVKILSGLFLALSIFSKTTLFLFIPSFILLSLWDIYKGKSVKEIILFFSTFLLASFFIIKTVFSLGGDKINLIYSSFGSWYGPKSLSALYSNVESFPMHPFWGSPFLFPLVILTLLRLFSILGTSKKVNTPEVKLIIWSFGSVILSPLMSGITNVRLLPLLIPLSILSSAYIHDLRLSKIRFLNLSKVSNQKKVVLIIINFITSIIFAAIFSKIVSTLLKRFFQIQLHFDIVLTFFIVLFAIVTFAFGSKKFLDKKLKFVFLLITCLPLFVFVRISLEYLILFRLINHYSNPILYLLMLGVFLLFLTYSLLTNYNYKNFAKFLIVVYVMFSLFGLSTVFIAKTYKFREASHLIGQVTDNLYVLGFYAHELSIENTLKPIYFAPRLAYVGEVNNDWEKYKPRYLIEIEKFEWTMENDPWPRGADLAKETNLVASFNLSRKFLTADRPFKLNVFEIID
ncbi:MAG: glycosyltransferase family 39 protein [Patescibacteria group bacterium]